MAECPECGESVTRPFDRRAHRLFVHSPAQNTSSPRSVAQFPTSFAVTVTRMMEPTVRVVDRGMAFVVLEWR